MKILHTAMITLTLVSPFAQAGSQTEADLVASAFAHPTPDAAQVDILTESELAATRGKLGPLALVAAIGGLDLALIGVYWGVYVPHYGGGGSCSGCTTSMYSQH